MLRSFVRARMECSRFANSSSSVRSGFGKEVKVTGGGPFVAIPQVTAIGNPSNLFAVEMPQDSPLDIRDDPMAISHSRSSDFNSELRISAGGLWYQRLRSSSPSTLLFASKGIVHVNRAGSNSDDSSSWKISNPSSLSSWTGHNLRLVENEGFMEVLGEGTFVFNSGSDCTVLQLELNETVSVNGSFLEATNANIASVHECLSTRSSQSDHKTIAFSKIKSILSQTLSSVGVASMRSMNKFPAAVSSAKKVSQLLTKLLPRKSTPLYYKITGPGKVLVRNFV